MNFEDLLHKLVAQTLMTAGRWYASRVGEKSIPYSALDGINHFGWNKPCQCPEPGRPKVPSYVVKILYTRMEAFVDKKGVPAGLQGQWPWPYPPQRRLVHSSVRTKQATQKIPEVEAEELRTVISRSKKCGASCETLMAERSKSSSTSQAKKGSKFLKSDESMASLDSEGHVKCHEALNWAKQGEKIFCHGRNCVLWVCQWNRRGVHWLWSNDWESHWLERSPCYLVTASCSSQGQQNIVGWGKAAAICKRPAIKTWVPIPECMFQLQQQRANNISKHCILYVHGRLHFDSNNPNYGWDVPNNNWLQHVNMHTFAPNHASPWVKHGMMPVMQPQHHQQHSDDGGESTRGKGGKGAAGGKGARNDRSLFRAGFQDTFIDCECCYLWVVFWKMHEHLAETPEPAKTYHQTCLKHAINWNMQYTSHKEVSLGQTGVKNFSSARTKKRRKKNLRRKREHGRRNNNNGPAVKHCCHFKLWDEEKSWWGWKEERNHCRATHGATQKLEVPKRCLGWTMIRFAVVGLSFVLCVCVLFLLCLNNAKQGQSWGSEHVGSKPTLTRTV